MSNQNINFLTSGLVQLNNPGTINGITSYYSNTSSSSTNSSTPTTSDCNIFPVNNTIDPTNTVYDNQTVLMVNSTINQTSNTVQAQYFDPVSGAPNNFCDIMGTGDWNYDLTNTSHLNAVYATSSLMSEDTTLYNNLQPTNNVLNGTGKHNIDITNCSTRCVQPIVSPGLFFSLTSQPYYTSNGSIQPGGPTDGSGCGSTGGPPLGAGPSYANVEPGYSNYNSDNFIFTSNYYIQQKNECLVIELVFTVSNTSSLNYNATSINGSPTVSVIVKNKVITKDVLASLSTNSRDAQSKVKIYTAGPIPLGYLTPGTTFNSRTATYFIPNNVPIVIANGYTKLYATMPLIYIPPTNPPSGSSSPVLSGLYLTQAGYTFSSSGSSSAVTPVIDISIGGSGGLKRVSGTPSATQYGYFVVGVAFSVDYSSYVNFACITAEVLIRNVWRSPIAIYNSYNKYSINDMATKQVVLLFGKSFNGGTFLVTNTGTPISSIYNYSVTSLRNFISIMRSVINLFDGSTSLVDYFINPSVIMQVNASGSYNITPLILQPLLDGAITNPSTIANCPGMMYLMVNSKNSLNMNVDPSEQTVFGQLIGFNYLGLQNSTLCATGNARYMNTNLNILSDAEGDLFGNSLSLGLNNIGTNSYYILIILPEAQFFPAINPSVNNMLTIYSTPNTLFYFMLTPNTASQFAPTSTGLVAASNTKTTGSTTTSTFNANPVFSINKVMLTVSNIKLF